jgi:hypothetical protein
VVLVPLLLLVKVMLVALEEVQEMSLAVAVARHR